MMKHSFNKSALAVALVSIGLVVGANAQNGPSGGKANPPGTAAQQGATQPVAQNGNVPADDRHFAEKACQAGMAEVAEGKLAQRKAQDEQVKQFGQRMGDDHTKANDQLKQIASTQGIDLPSKLDSKGQGELDQLEKLSGSKFDEAYIKKQVSAHQKAVEEFQKEANSGKDAQLREFAKNTLPTLEEHLRLAKSAQQDVMSKSASRSGTMTKSGSSGTPSSTGSSNGKSSSNPSSSNSASSGSGLEAAKKATGEPYVHAEKQAHVPVPKTGM